MTQRVLVKCTREMNAVIVCAFLHLAWVAIAATASPNRTTTHYKVLPRGCPPLVEGPVLNFVDGVVLARAAPPMNPFTCERVLECGVQASPPEVAISWFRDDELVETSVVRDVTMGAKEPLMGSGKERAFFGLGELVHRLCVDRLISAAPPLLAHHNKFQCRVESLCDKETPAIVSEPVVIEGKTGRRALANSIKNLVQHLHKSPLITLITTTRMELAGHLVAMMCRAEGQPKPTIQWSLLDEEGDGATPLTASSLPFIWPTENGDLLIDTSKTQAASLSFVCRAENVYGTDARSSTLILLKEEDD